MRKLALLTTIITLVITSTACIRIVSREKETESTAKATENNTENNTLGSTLEDLSNSENIDESIGKPISRNEFKLETEKGKLLVELSNADKYNVDNSLGRMDIAYKDDSEKCSTISFIRATEYEQRFQNIINNAVDGKLNEISKGNMSFNENISDGTTNSLNNNINNLDNNNSSSYSYNIVFYHYTDLGNENRWLHIINCGDYVILVENDNSEKVAKNIFSDMRCELL